MTRPVHFLVGVPGSGKTFAAKQLDQLYDRMPHDQFPARDYGPALLKRAQEPGDKPILAEAPFRVQALRDALHAANIPTRTYYLDVPLETARRQYETRDGKPYPAMHERNHARYSTRDWDHRGTQSEMIEALKAACKRRD